MFRSLALKTFLASLTLTPGAAFAQDAVNVLCPIGEERIDGKTFIEHNGNKVGFCCPGCDSAFLEWDNARKDEFVARAIEASGHSDHGAQRAPSVDEAAFGFTVKQIGRMRDALRDGQTQARVRLVEILDEHVVAVGALAGLEGEITIVDGNVWVSRAQGGNPVTTGPGISEQDQATLLTVASVPEWRSIRLEAHDTSLLELIEEHAPRGGLALDEPFPFVVDAESSDLALHVINGHCPEGKTASAAGTEPWRWTASNAMDAKYVGVYARNRAGEMTHHGSPIHAHALLEVNGAMVTGHVDEARLSGPAVLRLPLVAREPDAQAPLASGEVSPPAYPYTLDTCPISGKKLGSMGDPVVREYDGREVRLCCAGCIEAFEADKAKHWVAIDKKIVEQQLMHYPLDTCIVTGNELGESAVNHVHNNRLVRLADEDAVKAFEFEPAKYLTSLDKKIVELQLPNYPMDQCPVGGALGSMGEPVNFIYMNRLVRFCCAACEDDLIAEPRKHMVKLDKAYADAQREGYTLDTCVVSGAPLGSMGDPVELVAGTKLVRFCCDGCFPAFRKNPAKYMAKLK